MGVQQSKRTKIVCTMGPASDSELTLRNLIAEGMDIARLNFSHGSQNEHLARINRIKKVRRELNAPTAIMLDLRGPRIRTGALVDGTPVRLQAGKQITLTEAPVAGTSRLVQQTCAGLAGYMRPGTSILIDNGLIELAVDETRGSDIVCTVQNSGILREHKGMNFPGTQIDLPIMSEHDERDLLFGIEQGVDFVAVPAVRDAADLAVVRAFLDGNGGAGIGLIARSRTNAPSTTSPRSSMPATASSSHVVTSASRWTPSACPISKSRSCACATSGACLSSSQARCSNP